MSRRLAVFAGGWSLSGAEEVGSGTPVGPGQVVRLLAALVDKSLVQAEDTATGTRYRLLHAIKTFADEQLAAAEELDDIRARHGSYFADLGEHAAPGLHGRTKAIGRNASTRIMRISRLPACGVRPTRPARLSGSGWLRV